jgi:hypothetical protein
VTLPASHTHPITVGVYAIDRAGNAWAVKTATLPAS